MRYLSYFVIETNFSGPEKALVALVEKLVVVIGYVNDLNIILLLINLNLRNEIKHV